MSSTASLTLTCTVVGAPGLRFGKQAQGPPHPLAFLEQRAREGRPVPAATRELVAIALRRHEALVRAAGRQSGVKLAPPVCPPGYGRSRFRTCDPCRVKATNSPFLESFTTACTLRTLLYCDVV